MSERGSLKPVRKLDLRLSRLRKKEGPRVIRIHLEVVGCYHVVRLGAILCYDKVLVLVPLSCSNTMLHLLASEQTILLRSVEVAFVFESATNA